MRGGDACKSIETTRKKYYKDMNRNIVNCLLQFLDFWLLHFPPHDA